MSAWDDNRQDALEKVSSFGFWWENISRPLRMNADTRYAQGPWSCPPETNLCENSLRSRPFLLSLALRNSKKISRLSPQKFLWKSKEKKWIKPKALCERNAKKMQSSHKYWAACESELCRSVPSSSSWWPQRRKEIFAKQMLETKLIRCKSRIPFAVL